ncbi:MAG: glycosyltransferase family 39 protein [Anaerolineaceae bacterium]
MALFALSIVLVLGFLYSISHLAATLSISEKILFYFLCASAYVIVTLEIAGFLTRLNQPAVILILQAVFTAVSFFIFRKKLIPLKTLLASFKTVSVGSFVRKYPLAAVMVLVIAGFYGFLFFVSIHFPQNTSDSLYNHLSRIAYWLQQGSFNIYPAFNNIGSMYPLNNSVLMLWSVVFLRSDVLVGTVQFFATIAAAVILYALAVRFGFSRISGLLCALIFLTFPIVLFESITAQNDILAAAYIGAAILFLLNRNAEGQKNRLVFSALAMALAIGTKQYALFTLPGYILLAVIVIGRQRENKRKQLAFWTGTLVGLTVLLGLFSYARNIFIYQNPFGETRDINYAESYNSIGGVADRAVVNSLRLFSQFISCDGFPDSINRKCVRVKAAAFDAAFSKTRFNLESDKYLLSPDVPFSLTTIYPLNEESTWYGFLGWVLILPAFVYGIVYSIRRRKVEAIVIIATAILYFLATATFKNGWDEYLGRYLILAVLLIMPFASFIMSDKRPVNRILVALIFITGILISSYSIVNDYSRPLVGRKEMVRLYNESPMLIKKITYKTMPYITNEKSVWQESRTFQRAYGNQSFLIPLGMVDENVTPDSSLGIVAEGGYFPDYLFFGDDFSRRIYAIKDGQIDSQPEFPNLGYLLISPDFPDFNPSGFDLIERSDGWRLLKKAT